MRSKIYPCLEHLLFAGYLTLFAWLVTTVPFFKRSGLTAAQLLIVFLLKVLAGIFYGWIGVYYGNLAQMIDTWSYHYQSLPEANLFLSRPWQYFSGFFSSNYSGGYGGFLGEENSWWNDLDVNLFLKLLGVFNAASFGYYYVNVIFYSFLTLAGPIAFYRVCCDAFPGRKVLVLLAVFFIPSFLYWTSGLHKEGLIFTSIALVLYTVYFGLKESRLPWKRVVATLLSLLLLLAFRSYIFLLLLPAVLAWWLAVKSQRNPWLIFAIFYTACIILFFAGPYISPRFDFPAAVAGKQHQFLGLSGNSEVRVTMLQPTLYSFATNLPQAFSISILRPYISDIHHLLSLAAAVEINGLLILTAFYFWFNRRRLHESSFSLFCLFFSLSVLLFTGYTVNFLGAIVRYRSIVLPLLFVPVLVQLPWAAAINKFTNINNKNNS